MKKSTIAIVAALAAFAVFGPGDAFAQARAGAGAGSAKAGGVPLKIEKLTKPGASCLVPSPDFDGNVKSPGRGGTKKKWAALEAEYATSPDWIDAITFNFHVLSQDDEKTYHYYTATVTYVDVAKGKHGACVMLPPSAVARYAADGRGIVAFAVEVELEGKTVAAESDGLGKGKEWWKQLDGFKGKLERHSGVLQDRSKTPFGLTFIDQYEAVR